MYPLLKSHLRDTVRQADRYSDHPVLVLDALIQVLADPPLPIRREPETPRRVKLFDGADEAHSGLLNEVGLGELGVLGGADIAANDVVHHAQIHHN